MHSRTPHCLFLIILLLLNFRGLPIRGQTPTSLQIVIVEGEGAINNVKQRVNREPIVLVEDETHNPVAGASVTFFLPNKGPGYRFVVFVLDQNDSLPIAALFDVVYRALA